MNNLYKLRKQRGLTQKDVADVLGVSAVQYGHLENEKRSITQKNLEKLSEFFEVSIDYILGNSDSPTDPKTDSSAPQLGFREIREVPQLEVTEEFVSIPLVASLHCGYDYIGQPYDIIKKYDVPAQWVRKWGKNIVANKAKGNSMMPTIRPGDIMICIPGEAWADGNIVIIDINDSDTVKRIYHSQEDGGIDLVPDNQDFETVHYTREELELYRAHVLARVAKIVGPDLI